MRLFVTVAASMLCAEIALACSCGGQTPEEAVERAAFVFVGEVASFEWHQPRRDTDWKRESIPLWGPGVGGNEITFTVLTQWKGESTRALTVWTPPGAGGSCGMLLRPGDRWLIFAQQRGDGTLITSSCSGNQQLACARTSMERLDRLFHATLSRAHLEALDAQTEFTPVRCLSAPTLEKDVDQWPAEVDYVSAILRTDAGGRLDSVQLTACEPECNPDIQEIVEAKLWTLEFAMVEYEHRPVAMRFSWSWRRR